jgi:hypothetical protein
MKLPFKKRMVTSLKLPKYGVLLFLVSLFTACTKTIDLNLPFEGPQISVVASIDAAEGVSAFVSRTAPPTGTHLVDELRLTNATVSVFDEDGNEFTVPHRGLGFYELASLVVEQGKQYRLEVSSAGLETLRSDWVRIPKAVLEPNLDFTITLDTRNTIFPSHTIEMDFSGTDPSGDTYYLIDVYPDIVNHRTLIYTFLADFDARFCEVAFFQSPFFPDNCIQESTFSFQYIPQITVFDDAGERVSLERLVFALRSIDETYYNFLRDKLALDGQTGVILEPRPSTTNVSGGVGVFLASNSFVEVVAVP